MTYGVLRLPERILFGPGVRGEIPALVSELGSRAFVVVDPFLASTADFQTAVAALLDRGVEVRVYSDIQAELPVDSLDVAGQIAAEFSPDVVIGYGGGSALDAAKLIALLASHGGALSKYYGENAVPGSVIPIVAVPTTSGTGSEVTPVAVVSDPDREMKVGISSPHLIPRRAIVDPELTLAVPCPVTAHSGIDALVHAIESYTARDITENWPAATAVFVGANTLSRSMSLEAVRAITPALPRAYEEPNDLAARTSMSRGSLLAGMAFGSTGTHLAHALQYPIGALTHTPHGLGTGLMLPYVLQASVGAIATELEHIGGAMGILASSPADVIAAISDLNRRIGLPASLAEIGVKADDVAQIAELALRATRLVNIAPIPVDAKVLENILHAALAGDPFLIGRDTTQLKGSS